MLRTISILALVVGLAAPASATTWARDDQDDPFSDGTCIAHSPMSYGGYIYGWPSKYELVFWPFTDPHWIWYCPESGYVAFGSDFEVDETERAAIAAVLAERQSEWSSRDWTIEGDQAWRAMRDNRPVLLEQLEAVARSRPGTDWAWYNRVLAQLHQADVERAGNYRLAAQDLLRAGLAEDTGAERIDTLYLLGTYSHWFGDAEAARAYFQEARTVEWTNEDGETATGIPYINEIVDEVEGGALIEQWGEPVLE